MHSLDQEVSGFGSDACTWGLSNAAAAVMDSRYTELFRIYSGGIESLCICDVSLNMGSSYIMKYLIVLTNNVRVLQI